MTDQRQQQHAWLACISCSERKRKCDRKWPECGLCIQSSRKCEYSLPLWGPTPQSVDSSASFSSSRGKYNDFPVALFLDSIVFEQCGMSLPLPLTLQSTTVQSYTDDADEIYRIATQYFNTLHLPLAFISKTRFYGILLSSASETRPDIALLFLCMKLIVSEPASTDVGPDTTQLYRTAKDYVVQIELSRVLTIYTLQSALLIALYEIGHGIYPSAYITIGWCARYGAALGLDKELGSFDNTTGRWIEKEERNRAWWTILLLDRHVNLGCPHLSLCTPDPPADGLLPIEDEDWNQGMWRVREPVRLGSAGALKVGRFARIVQAMNLLTMSTRVAAEDKLDMLSTQEHFVQLDRALRALSTLNATETELRSTLFCVPHTICVDALIMLHSRIFQDEHRSWQMTTQSQPTLASIARQSAIVLEGLLEGKRGSPGQYCPLLFGWIYRSTAVALALDQMTPGQEYSQTVRTNKQALGVIGKRWLVADTYLHLLDNRELTIAPLALQR